MDWRRRGEEERRRERRRGEEEGEEERKKGIQSGGGEKEGYTSWFNNEWYSYDEGISKTLSLKIYDNCRVRLVYYIRVGKVHTQVKQATIETLKLFVVTGMSLAWVSDSHTPTL